MGIHELIKDLRIKKGYTQIDLADLLGCNRQKVADWERGKAYPSIKDLVLLTKIFDVSADYLLGLTIAATNDKDKQFISDYTGLSSDSIDLLNFLKNNEKEDLSIVNFLLESSLSSTQYKGRAQGIPIYKPNIFSDIFEYFSVEESETMAIFLGNKTFLDKEEQKFVKNVLNGDIHKIKGKNLKEEKIVMVKSSSLLETYYFDDICDKIRDLKEEYKKLKGDNNANNSEA